MKPQNSLPVGTQQILLSLHRHSAGPGFGVTRLEGDAMREFLPRGLFIWGATEDTYVTRLQSGNQIEGDVNVQSRIPARYFGAGKTLEVMRELAERGELEGAVEPRQILAMQKVEPGVLVRLDIDGPFENACLWGLTRDSAMAPPPRRARIELLTVTGPLRPEERSESRWVGEVIESKLDGDRVVFEASGPSAEVVATMISAFANGPRYH